MPDPEDLATLTVPDVCRILRRSKWSVYADVKRGELRAVRVGPRDLRFRPEDIVAYLDARATANPTAPVKTT